MRVKWLSGIVALIFAVAIVGVAAADNGSPATVNSSNVITFSSVGAGDGAYQNFTLAYPGHNNNATVAMSFSPFYPTAAHAVGVNAYQSGTLIQAMNGVGNPPGTHSMSFNSSSGQPVDLQVYNFDVGVTVSFQLTVTGFATAIAPEPTATPVTASSNGLPASGSLAGNPSGAFAYYTAWYSGGSAQSVNLSFSPNNGTISSGVYVVAYQGGHKIGSARGTDAKTPGVLPVWYHSDSAGLVTFQVADYAPGATVWYYLSQ